MAGTVAVTVVEVTALGATDRLGQNVTVVTLGLVKPDPLIVTTVVPAGPLCGEKPVMIGVAACATGTPSPIIAVTSATRANARGILPAGT